MSAPHYHEDENGTLVKCYHNVKTFLADWKFWAGVTLSFPIEHWLYERGPLHFVTIWLGL